MFKNFVEYLDWICDEMKVSRLTKDEVDLVETETIEMRKQKEESKRVRSTEYQLICYMQDSLRKVLSARV